MKMKKRAPVFTYFIAWLNPIIPPTITGLRGASIVCSAKDSSQLQTWHELHYQGMLAGHFFCLGLSLWYYIRIRIGRIQQHQWTRLERLVPGGIDL